MTARRLLIPGLVIVGSSLLLVTTWLERVIAPRGASNSPGETRPSTSRVRPGAGTPAT